MKDEIIKRYKEKIKKIYANSSDNELAHSERDKICIELIKELGYEDLADLLKKVEEDIIFWYAQVK